MHSSKLGEQVQIFASIGVLVGLALVFMEIRQNNDLVAAELRAVRLVSWETFSRHEVETDITEVFLKSIENPDDLTDAEILKLSAYLTNLISLHQQDAALQQAGLANYGATDFSAGVSGYFNGRFARAWFDINRVWIARTTPEVADGIARYIESTPVEERHEYLKLIRDRF